MLVGAATGRLIRAAGDAAVTGHNTQREWAPTMDLNQIVDFEFETRMSDADALLWSIEKDPLLRTTIASVFLLDGPPDRERLLRRLRSLKR